MKCYTLGNCHPLKVICITFFTTPSMQIMLSIYLKSGTCIYLSLDSGVTMASKRRENINLVSFVCFSFLVISSVLHIEDITWPGGDTNFIVEC